MMPFDVQYCAARIGTLSQNNATVQLDFIDGTAVKSNNVLPTTAYTHTHTVPTL